MTPQEREFLYGRLFELDDAKAVLADLETKFGKASYVAGGHEADRQTCYNEGAKAVIQFIRKQIGDK